MSPGYYPQRARGYLAGAGGLRRRLAVMTTRLLRRQAPSEPTQAQEERPGERGEGGSARRDIVPLPAPAPAETCGSRR